MARWIGILQGRINRSKNQKEPLKKPLSSFQRLIKGLEPTLKFKNVVVSFENEAERKVILKYLQGKNIPQKWFKRQPGTTGFGLELKIEKV
jgi:hypothetical protein